eukprot:1156186-Pelagomonas_calceolata.AAC.12
MSLRGCQSTALEMRNPLIYLEFRENASENFWMGSPKKSDPPLPPHPHRLDPYIYQLTPLRVTYLAQRVHSGAPDLLHSALGYQSTKENGKDALTPPMLMLIPMAIARKQKGPKSRVPARGSSIYYSPTM